MGIQVVAVGVAIATNVVAAAAAIDLAAAAQLEPGPVFPNVGAGNAVMAWNLAPGLTPGTYVIKLQQSADNVTFTDVASITEAAPVAVLGMTNVTISKRYVRVNVTDATALAGTVDLYLLSA